MKIYISHSGNYDYLNNLYAPLKSSKICKDNEVYFPHDGVPVNTKNIIGSFDLIIAEVSFPTTGQGIELGWADFCNVPILCIYQLGSKISSSIKLVTNNLIEYSNMSDMIQKIEDFVNKNNIDFRYVTKDESRDFHSKRRAFVIYQDQLFFIEQGSSMSHWEFCSSKLDLNKDIFNQLTRGYYLEGNLVFYKDNFSYDDDVIKEAIPYINQIKKILNINEVKIYFGLIVGKPGEDWAFEYYYGDSLSDNTIIKNS